MLKSTFGTNQCRSTDISERNIYELIWVIQNEQRYDATADNKNFRQYGAVKLQVGGFNGHKSPIMTKRTRTVSTSDRALKNPLIHGTVKTFCRSKGHGFITPMDGAPEIFVHISDIEGEYIPQEGDEVSYRICAIPPKYEKYQAIHVQITNLTPNVHTKWETPSYN